MALEPNSERTIRPYLHDDVPDGDFGVKNVTTVDVTRTFWDKIVILHGLRRWFDNRGELKGNGQRVSRHHCDVHQLLGSDAGQMALKDRKLCADCVTHARMFFNRPAFDLATATPPTFCVRSEGAMLDGLRRDYRAMSGMIFGDAPAFEDVVGSLEELETALNAPEMGEVQSGGHVRVHAERAQAADYQS